MSKIYQHPSGGSLYQVGASEIPNLVARKNIDLIIFNACEIQPENIYPQIQKFYAPFQDSLSLTEDELKNALHLVNIASSLACKFLSNGKNVISSCAAGLNRSGLTSAFTIAKCTNAPKKAIIDHIRQNRNPAALSNGLFVRVFLAS